MGVFKLGVVKGSSGMVCPRFKVDESGSSLGGGSGVCVHRDALEMCGVVGGAHACYPAVEVGRVGKEQEGLLAALREASALPEGITCVAWESMAGGGKRCGQYAGNGGCRRTDEFMCVEWLKINEPEAYERTIESCMSRLTSLRPSGATGAPAVEGGSVVVSKGGGAHVATESEEVPSVEEVLPSGLVPVHVGVSKSLVPAELATEPRPFGPDLVSDDALREIEEAGIEVKVATTDLEDVWLVSEFTNEDRPELTFRMARTLLVTMSVFPGAVVRAIRRSERRRNQKDPLA